MSPGGCFSPGRCSFCLSSGREAEGTDQNVGRCGAVEGRENPRALGKARWGIIRARKHKKRRQKAGMNNSPRPGILLALQLGALGVKNPQEPPVFSSRRPRCSVGSSRRQRGRAGRRERGGGGRRDQPGSATPARTENAEGSVYLSLLQRQRGKVRPESGNARQPEPPPNP